MKKLFIIFLFAGLIVSCKKSSDFLDPTTSTVDEAVVFSDSARTMQFLNSMYTDVAWSYVKWRWDNHGGLDPATDDAEYRYSGGTQKAVMLYSGTYNAANSESALGGTGSDFWRTPWVEIRRANLLLSKLPATPLSASLQKRVAMEARFLRVWYYFHLVRAFGGVALIGDKVYGNEDIINIPRNTFAECIDYMVKELDDVAAQIPSKSGYAEQDYGRATSGACLALKSRILLYAASPLFNGGSTATTDDLKKLVSYPTYDAARWQKAADAAKAVIDLGAYSLEVNPTGVTKPGFGFYNLFLKRVNNEQIFSRLRPANRDWEGFYLPPTRSGNYYHTPTQNLVDAFPMKNGKAITEAGSGYDPTKPYNNRDPRFGYSIIYNGSNFYRSSTNNQQPVYTYIGAASDGYNEAGSSATSTGYYVRKTLDSASGANTERPWILMRYAEILLNYAEAINETGHPELAYPKLFELRNRAGIDAGSDGYYGLKQNMTVDEMRAIIQNERRIELAFEEQRYWDIRRWKIAMTVMNGYNKVMKITQVSAGVYTYQVANSIRMHVFRPEMYLFPIFQSEISKMPAMVQNPGW